MKTGPFTALVIGLTAVVAGGGVAIAYETLVVGQLQDKLAYEEENRELTVEVVGDYSDAIGACWDLIDLHSERTREALDAYSVRSEASEDFFTHGGFYAGDSGELFFRFDRADQIMEDAYAFGFDEEALTDDCYDLPFLN